jgi:cell division protein FtsB
MAELRKSRRSPGSILRLGPLVWAGLLCAFLAAAAIGFVWHRNRNEQLLRANAKLRQEIEARLKLNQDLEAQLQFMTRPDVLAARARAMGMVQPEPAQILKVPLTPRSGPVAALPPGQLATERPAARPGGVR